MENHISGELLIVRVGKKMFVITGEKTNSRKNILHGDPKKKWKWIVRYEI